MLSGDSTPQGDEISEVLDYEYLISALDETLNLQRASLLETLANRLLDRILKPRSVEAATVVITKLDVLGGDGQLGCSITRIKQWCRGWDLNPRSSTHRSLSPAPLTSSGTPARSLSTLSDLKRAEFTPPLGGVSKSMQIALGPHERFNTPARAGRR